MIIDESAEAVVRRLGFDTRSALKIAREGRIEAWVHRYLLAGSWANPEFSEGLKREKRWWRGPLEVDLTDLSPAVGPQPEMEYVVDAEHWQARICALAESFTDPLALPPLIAEYRLGALSVRDGNKRFAAMDLLDWTKCWVIIWYNSEGDYRQHNETILG